MTARVKIVSEGAGPTSTVLVDGKVLEGVTAVTWSCRAGEFAQATITVDSVEVDLAAHDTETVFADAERQAVLT
jgi:hypothetical protein